MDNDLTSSMRSSLTFMVATPIVMSFLRVLVATRHGLESLKERQLLSLRQYLAIGECICRWTSVCCLSDTSTPEHVNENLTLPKLFCDRCQTKAGVFVRVGRHRRVVKQEEDEGEGTRYPAGRVYESALGEP